MGVTVLVLLFSLFSQAQVYREPLFRKPEETKPEAPAVPSTQPSAPRARPAPGNLPVEYRGSASVLSSENPVILPPRQPMERYGGFTPGDVISAEIVGGVIAFPDSGAPVIARVTTSLLRGGVFLGEAKMERNSKRILIQFDSFRPKNSRRIFPVLAVARSGYGTLGVVGKHHSGEAKYFTAEIIAGFAAAYADSLVERSITPFGQRIDEPSVSNAGKKALGSAMSRTADRFAEKLKAAPEFVVLKDQVHVEILVRPDSGHEEKED